MSRETFKSQQKIYEIDTKRIVNLVKDLQYILDREVKRRKFKPDFDKEIYDYPLATLMTKEDFYIETKFYYDDNNETQQFLGNVLEIVVDCLPQSTFNVIPKVLGKIFISYNKNEASVAVINENDLLLINPSFLNIKFSEYALN